MPTASVRTILLLVGLALLGGGCGDDFDERANKATMSALREVEALAEAVSSTEIDRRVVAAYDAPDIGFGGAGERGPDRDGVVWIELEGPARGDDLENIRALQAILEAAGVSISRQTCGLNHVRGHLTTAEGVVMLLEVQRHTGAITLSVATDHDHELYPPTPRGPDEEQCWPS